MLGDHTRGLTADELLDAVAEAVVVVDAQGTIVWANRRAEQIMGRAREDWVGSSGLALIHPDDLHLAALSLGTITDKEVGSPIEVRVATHDGWRLTEVIGAPLGDGRVVLSMRDLTQRRRWEVAGNDVARFRSLVQNSSALTMLVRSDGTVTSVSAAITRLLGHDPEDVGGTPLDQLVAGDDRAAVETALRRAVTGASSASAPTVVEVSLLTSADAVSILIVPPRPPCVNISLTRLIAAGSHLCGERRDERRDPTNPCERPGDLGGSAPMEQLLPPPGDVELWDDDRATACAARSGLRLDGGDDGRLQRCADGVVDVQGEPVEIERHPLGCEPSGRRGVGRDVKGAHVRPGPGRDETQRRHEPAVERPDQDDDEAVRRWGSTDRAGHDGARPRRRGTGRRSRRCPCGTAVRA